MRIFLVLSLWLNVGLLWVVLSKYITPTERFCLLPLVLITMIVFIFTCRQIDDTWER